VNRSPLLSSLALSLLLGCGAAKHEGAVAASGDVSGTEELSARREGYQGVFRNHLIDEPSSPPNRTLKVEAPPQNQLRAPSRKAAKCP